MYKELVLLSYTSTLMDNPVSHNLAHAIDYYFQSNVLGPWSENLDWTLGIVSIM